jgi:acyl-CoA dehydrogenase
VARQEAADSGDRLLEDPGFRRKVAEQEIAIMALDWTERRLNSGRAVGESVGNAAASMKKLSTSQMGQNVEELMLEALGRYALPDQRASLGVGANEPPVGPEYAAVPTARYLNGRASTVFGGSSEIQHNILARILGL